MVNPDDIIDAAKINCTACQSCAGVHVNLMDADGELVATAVVPAEHWGPFLKQFHAAMNEISLRTHSAPRGKSMLRRSFKNRARYQRDRKAILEHKRVKNATNRHTRSLQRAIQAARVELQFITGASHVA